MEPIATKTIVIDGKEYPVKVLPYIPPPEHDIVWAHRKFNNQRVTEPIPYGGIGEYVQTHADKD